jgi:hypothetical protein
MISFPLFPCSSLDSFAPSFFLSVSNLFVSFVTSCFSTTTQSQISLSKHFTVCRRISKAGVLLSRTSSISLCSSRLITFTPEYSRFSTEHATPYATTTTPSSSSGSFPTCHCSSDFLIFYLETWSDQISRSYRVGTDGCRYRLRCS